MITRTLAAATGAALLLTGCSVTIGAPDDAPSTATVYSSEQEYVDNLLSSDGGWTEDDAWYSVDVAKTICRQLEAGNLEFEDIPGILYDNGMDPVQGGTMVGYGVQAFCPDLQDEMLRQADEILDN